jgi:hypothetical protein
MAVLRQDVHDVREADDAGCRVVAMEGVDVRSEASHHARLLDRGHRERWPAVEDETEDLAIDCDNYT